VRTAATLVVEALSRVMPPAKFFSALAALISGPEASIQRPALRLLVGALQTAQTGKKGKTAGAMEPEVSFSPQPLFSPLSRCFLPSAADFSPQPLISPLSRCFLPSAAVFSPQPLFSPLSRCFLPSAAEFSSQALISPLSRCFLLSPHASCSPSG
jgi:hypothetical protein